MNLVFITEARFTKNKNGQIYYENPSFCYQLWENYLNVFDFVYVAARVIFDEDHDKSRAFIATGENVSFIELPYFVGAKDYLLNYNKLRNSLSEILNIKEASYLCRLPGNVGHTAVKVLQKADKPFGVEVVGDPWDIFSPKAVQHPLRSIIQKISYRRLKYDVRFAAASLFVTKNYLQKRYKPTRGTYTTAVSDVIIDKDDFYLRSNLELNNNERFNLLSVGSLDQLYKSPDILLKSLKEVIQMGHQIHLNWLGDGVYKNSMINFAKALNIEENVTFHGNVGRDEVRKYLKNADAFALISQTEGLPKAMVEAMSHSLPCIGSKVGGIPELIDEECIVPVNDYLATSVLISKFITDSTFRKKHSELNFSNSINFEKDLLSEQRNNFLQYLKNIK